jgi:methionyl-tRNA formyltransferase
MMDQWCDELPHVEIKKGSAMSILRIIYMGTPSYAVPALEALAAHRAPGDVLESGYEIVAVITRPDKPSGRGKEIVFSPVKQAALAHGLHVWQPGSFKRAENVEALAAYHADLFVVAAFGQILPQAVLDLPRYGTLNIHASLLPRYRGASPISEALLQGERETGVTIMLIDAGVDTGPLLLARRVPIEPDETTGSLTEKLAQVGAEALLEVLPRWIAGEIQPQAQDEQLATHTHMVKREEGEIDWSRPADYLARMSRAYTPWPGAYTTWRGKLLKIASAHPANAPSSQELAPGTVVTSREHGQPSLLVATGNGLLSVERLQLEGKKEVSANEFLRGYPHIQGDRLGRQ